MESVTEPAEQASESDRATGPAAPSREQEAMLLGAAGQARAALNEFSGEGAVGEYLGASIEDAASATHRFLADLPGYRGWQWAVVVAAYPGADHVTISELVLIPGPTALLAPQWLPWQDRVRPGDLGPGDLLAPPPDDPRLVPGYLATGDPLIDDMARSTRRVCRDCAFYLPLGGALGVMFGVCANDLSADGHVVEAEYGCGAHSDTPQPPGTGSPMYEPYDDGVLDVAE
ncbi:DUF3027 domain-containing protein [Mycolicibacterium sp. CBMA 295]|uniref:DUF3027 domain-containing protein n=1 Tax=Mycolicibacterium sp. CBMA 295 TaxID=2606605 RepID=UPI0012DD0508|nr:DUF3027 domain-containing protein [Mycolicibacterium sp. CBMA 295]